MKKYYKLIKPYKDGDFYKVNTIYPEDVTVPRLIWPLPILVREHSEHWIQVFPKFKYGK